VSYGFGELQPVLWICKYVPLRMLIPVEPLSANLLRRIQAGALESPRTSNKIRRIIRDLLS
jgi:hypothetical protein